MEKKGVSHAFFKPTLKCMRVVWANTDLDAQTTSHRSENENLDLIMFQQFIKRRRQKLDLFAQTLFIEGDNISQSFKDVCSLQSRELSVSSIIHLWLSLPVPGYVQIGSSTFPSLSFFKDERQCIQTHCSTSFSPTLLCLLQHSFSAAAQV